MKNEEKTGLRTWKNRAPGEKGEHEKMKKIMKK